MANRKDDILTDAPGPSGCCIPRRGENTTIDTVVTVDTMNYFADTGNMDDAEEIDLGPYDPPPSPPPWESGFNFGWTANGGVNESRDVNGNRYSPCKQPVQDSDRKMVDTGCSHVINDCSDSEQPVREPDSDWTWSSPATPVEVEWSREDGLVSLGPAVEDKDEGEQEQEKKEDWRFQPRLRSLRNGPRTDKRESEKPLRIVMGISTMELKKDLFIEVVATLGVPLPMKSAKATAEYSMVGPKLLRAWYGDENVDWERLGGIVAEWEMGLQLEEEKAGQ